MYVSDANTMIELYRQTVLRSDHNIRQLVQVV